MRDQIDALQSKECWKSHMSSMIASCIINKAKAIKVTCWRGSRMVEILVESRAGSWRLLRSQSDIGLLVRNLNFIFPVEAGRRGQPRSLPTFRVLSDAFKFWVSLLAKEELFLSRCNTFLNGLLSLPPYISRSRCVLEFLLPWRNRDEPAIVIDECPYQRSLTARESLAESKGQLSMRTMKFKIVNDTDTIVVCYYSPVELDYVMLVADVVRKLALERESLRLAYRDPDGDIIQIRDDDDLQVAMSTSNCRLFVVPSN